MRLEAEDAEKNLLFNMVQTAYNACMDTATIEMVGSRPLLVFLQGLNDLYPANPPESASSESLEWFSNDGIEISRTMDFLMGIGVESLMTFKLDVRFDPLFVIIYNN